MKTIAKAVIGTSLSTAALVVILPSGSANADGPTLRREPGLPTAGGVSIGAVKRHDSAPWSSGAIEYDVLLVNGGSEAVKTSVVLSHEGAPVVQNVVVKARSKETITIADPAGLTHCARSSFLLRIGSQTAPPITVDVNANCTFQTTTLSGIPNAMEEPTKLTYGGAHPATETKCDIPLRFDAILANNNFNPALAQYGVRPPTGAIPWASFATRQLGPQQRRPESFASLPFRGEPGRYTVVIRDKNGNVPAGEPGAGVDITRTCNPEVIAKR
jgi:hypothetical protein